MNAAYYLVSYLRVIPRKTLTFLYNYYNGIPKNNPTRMEDVSDFTAFFNHIQNLIEEPTEILTGIYLGNAYNSCNYSTFEYYNIKNVINVSDDLPNYFEDQSRYLNIKIKDDSQHHIYDYIDTILHFFNEIQPIDKDNAVLIHCYMGSSRSACVILLYMVHFCGYGVDSALKVIKEKRPVVNINKNFLEDLNRWFIERKQ